MNFNKLLQSLFGNKSSKDMKLIQPLVEKVKAAYSEIKALSNDCNNLLKFILYFAFILCLLRILGVKLQKKIRTAPL